MASSVKLIIKGKQPDTDNHCVM